MSTASSRSPAAELSDPDRLARLASLRAALDQVDDALHDGLMRRAALVAQVGSLGAKGRVPLRPGREASILRRLLARNGGPLEAATVVRVWRELLAGSSAQQGPMRVVAGSAELLPTVCEHFGALAAAETASPAAAIAAVADGRAAVAVLPVPGPGVTWWTLLLEERWRGVHIVARLPFWARAGVPEALVLSAAAPDPSGADRTVIAVTGSDGAPALAETEGLVTADELRSRGITGQVLGAYAIPIGAEP